jgi:hypothetical protein
MDSGPQLVLPMTMAPADSRRSMTVALYGGVKCSRILDDAVVRTPRVQMLSLTAIGTPASGASRHRPGWPSMIRARSRARSPVSVLNACRSGSLCSIRSSVSRHTSVADRAPALTASRVDRTVPAPVIR